MLLEVSSEERLVGKIIPVGYFFQWEIGGLQSDFDFQCEEFIDDFFSGNLTYLFSNGRKVACRNTKLLGIKGYIPLCGTVGVYQVNELFEDEAILKEKKK